MTYKSKGDEFARYGDGWVKRPDNSTKDWEAIDESKVPDEILEQEGVRNLRHNMKLGRTDLAGIHPRVKDKTDELVHRAANDLRPAPPVIIRAQPQEG